MPASTKKIQYKLFTAIIIFVCGFHIIYFSTSFEADIETDRAEGPVPKSQELKSYQVIQEDFTSASGNNSMAWQTWQQSTKVDMMFEDFSKDWHYWWISSRIQTLWPEFEHSGLKIKGNCDETNGTRKKILMLPGVLQFTNYASQRVIKSGGSLGELTQWADLIAGCLALCHYVDVKINFKAANAYLRSRKSQDKSKNGCTGNWVDIIFTDIGGIRGLSSDVVELYKNKFRILDVYGTEAAYNDPEYAEEKKLVNSWGMLGLHLKQFYTMFPHTPDNSFLGFVISSQNLLSSRKSNFSLIIGKDVAYLKGKMEILETINEIFPVAATLPDSASRLLPKGAMTFGVVSPAEYKSILIEAKVCLGLGDPIESPSPLLSLAAGCIFMNPKKNQSLSGKPTNRKITSQHVYLERYFGPPHVYTYDPNDLKGLRLILNDILHVDKVQPIIPKAFTVLGYLKRLESYLIEQDFCGHEHFSINDSLVRVYLSGDLSSCSDVCYRKGLICEPDYFVKINHAKNLKRWGVTCRNTMVVRHLFPPAYSKKTKTCFFQPSEKPLFSCSAESLNGVFRVCPCIRDNYGEFITKNN